MEQDDVAGREGEVPDTHPGDQLFNVVYDPRFDRFFLEDEDVYRGRNRTLDRKAVSIPWEKWILPPKSPPKRGQQGGGQEPSPKLDNTSILPNAAVEVKNRSINASAGEDNQAVTVPVLDFSNFSTQNPKDTLSDLVVGNKPKKTRVQDYTVHFKRTNQDVAKIMAAGITNAEPNDDHEVKWNGEVFRVQFPGLQYKPQIEVTTDSSKPDALQGELLRGPTEEQWPGSTYELKNLMRIRAHADGLRRVNLANRFVAVSSSESSESSESEEEVAPPPKEESEDENELMPVFFRDDRVLFHAKQRWFKGTVRRRIPKSDFYNIRADNGSLFDAVLASKMELLAEPEELPYYHYTRGDKVLWVPDGKETSDSRRRQRHSNNSDDEELTYKAKIVQVRSLNRFDLLLRTNRVVKKVPYEQLRPRDESDFVSTTTSERR